MNFSYFLCDKNQVTHKIKIGFFKLIRSIVLYLKVSSKYKENKIIVENKAIENIRKKCNGKMQKNTEKYNSNEITFTALRLHTIYRFWSYIFRQSDLCLNRSYALTYALVYLGIPCTLVIGRSEYFLNRKYDFHAWVEINDFPINDSISVKSQWHKVCIM